MSKDHWQHTRHKSEWPFVFLNVAVLPVPNAQGLAASTLSDDPGPFTGL